MDKVSCLRTVFGYAESAYHARYRDIEGYDADYKRPRAPVGFGFATDATADPVVLGLGLG